MKKYLPTLIILVLVLGLGGLVGWLALRPAAGGPGRASSGPDPVAVEVRPVTSGVLREVRRFTGTLESSARFTVASKVGGLVESVLVDLGDRVEHGQTVARIDDAELAPAVAQAEADLAVRQAELARAESDLLLAEREFERGQQLGQRGIAAEAQLDEIEANLRAARASVRLAEAQVERAQSILALRRLELGYTRVRASWSEEASYGLVAERHQDTGNTVKANDPVVTIVSLDPLKAVVSVTERDYAGLRVGQHATLTTDGAPGRAFDCEIVRISPVFSEASRQARVELSVPNPEGLLRPGMFVRVSLVLREVDAGTIVPLDALARRGGKEVVFVVEDGADTVRMVPVERGVVETGLVEIVQPPIRGRVVTLGQQLLGDGSPVAVAEPDEGDLPRAAEPPAGDDA